MNDSQRSSRLAPRALMVAALASAGATLVVGRFGLAGTLVGAALLPVLVALIEEVARRPAERVGKMRQAARRRRVPPRAPSGGEATVVRTYRTQRSWTRTLGEVSWPRVTVTGAAAFALVVGAFTLAELALGDSVASDRRTTFFSRRDDASREKPSEERRETPTTRTQEETTPTETTPEEETTVPTDSVPATTTVTTEEADPTTTAP